MTRLVLDGGGVGGFNTVVTSKRVFDGQRHGLGIKSINIAKQEWPSKGCGLGNPVIQQTK